MQCPCRKRRPQALLSHGPAHLSVTAATVQPVLHIHVASMLNLQRSSEDLSTQVTKASNVALDPRGQESLRAGGKGNGLVLVKNRVTGRIRWDPHPGGTFRLQRKPAVRTTQRFSFSQSPEETLEDQASAFKGYTRYSVSRASQHAGVDLRPAMGLETLRRRMAIKD